jgi:hypothetical protein
MPHRSRTATAAVPWLPAGRRPRTTGHRDHRSRRPPPNQPADDHRRRLQRRPDAASIRYLTGRQSIAGRGVHYHDAWEIAGQGPGHTWTVENPNARGEIEQIVRQPRHRRRLDYVFIGSWHAHPQAHCHVRAATLAFDQPTDGLWPSDHFGVVVDVEIGTND